MNLNKLLNPCLLGLMLITTYSTADIEILDRVAVVVDGGVILESDISARTHDLKLQLQQNNIPLPPAKDLHKQVVDRMILDSIQLQMGERAGIRIDDDTLSKAMVHLAQQNNMTLSEFQQKLQSTDISYEQLRNQMKQDLIINKVQQRQVADRIRITQQEVERFFESEFGKQKMAASYQLQHILVAADESTNPQLALEKQAMSESIKKELDNGASFSDLAKRYSDAPNAANGGDLGMRPAEQLPSLFLNEASTMAIGEVRGPVKAGNGFHILKLIAQQGGQKTHLIQQSQTAHILIRPSAILTSEEAKIKLEQIRSDIMAGAGFGAMAKAFSDDPGSGSNDGSLGWVNPGEMVPTFEEVMNATAVGQVSPVFESPFGWHILKVNGRRQEDMSDQYRIVQARQALHARKYEEQLEQWLQKIRAEAYVDIKIDI